MDDDDLWFKVWFAFVGLLAFGFTVVLAWALIELVQWVTSK